MLVSGRVIKAEYFRSFCAYDLLPLRVPIKPFQKGHVSPSKKQHTMVRQWPMLGLWSTRPPKCLDIHPLEFLITCLTPLPNWYTGFDPSNIRVYRCKTWSTMFWSKPGGSSKSLPIIMARQRTPPPPRNMALWAGLINHWFPRFKKAGGTFEPY